MFHIVDVETGEVVLTAETGPEAGRKAQELNEAYRSEGSPRRVRVVRAEDDDKPKDEPKALALGSSLCAELFYRADQRDECAGWMIYYRRDIPESGISWRRREAAKVQKLPWHNEPWWAGSEAWALHYPHPSAKRPGMLCYTPSEQHGREDRQLRTTAGRYLRKYFSDVLSEEQIQAYALEWSNLYAPRELEIVTTPEKIVHVYENGPSSCMSKQADEYDGPVHPCHIYGAGDLGVGFIRDAHGRITGRALVWPDRKVHGRIYGDIERMEKALEDAGYTRGSLEGARLLRIPVEDGFVAPYIDDYFAAEDCGDYLRIAGYGEIPCNKQNGLSGNVGICCEDCGDRVHEDDAYYNEFLDRYECEHCYRDNVTCCDFCDEDFLSRDAREVDEYTVCEDCYQERFVACYECGDDVHWDDAMQDASGDFYCQSCYDDRYARCSDCDDEIERADVVEDSKGNYYCQSCYDDRYTHCSECEDEIEHNDAVQDSRGDDYCQSCYNERYARCSDCDDEIEHQDAFVGADETDVLCRACHEQAPLAMGV